MKRRLIVLGLILLLASCTTAGNKVLLQENFSISSPFHAVDKSFGTVDVSDGLLKITAKEPNGMMIARTGLSVENLYIEISGMPQTQGDAVYFGIACRLLDASNYVYFAISSSGEAMIVKVRDGQQQVLAHSSSQQQIPINYGGRINKVGAQCNGNELVFWLNDQQILMAKDAEPTTGDVAVFVSSQKAPKTVLFDDLTVAEFAEQAQK